MMYTNKNFCTGLQKRQGEGVEEVFEHFIEHVFKHIIEEFKHLIEEVFPHPVQDVEAL